MRKDRPKIKQPRAKRSEAITLTTQDQFYIEQHGEDSVEELAKVLNKPTDIIRPYFNKLAVKHASSQKPRTSRLIDRPAKGVTAMNREASMSGDDGYAKAVTLDAIHKAMAEGKADLVKELQLRYDEQNQKNKAIIRQKCSPFLHYIEQPDDDAEVY